MQIKFVEKEYWYGGCTVDGSKMPIDSEMQVTIDLSINKTPNQAMPFFVSSKGRYLWRDTGFEISFDHGIIHVSDDVICEDGFGNLRNAYLAAMEKYFPFNHKTPAIELFETPIYNTWIELTFYQNQQAIEKYAMDILENGLPSGVLMIDDGWSNSYGDWRFHSGNFPDPKGMITGLTSMGYSVILWICPFVTPDTIKYREARDRNLLVLTPVGEPYIAKWWNGYSAVLDMTNPEAVAWLGSQLKELQELGVAGFKFDAGDSRYYREDNLTFSNATPNEQSIAWTEFGEKYPFNEYRVTFKAGGKAIMQRLCDKGHVWGENGIASLIPDTLVQGITGHPYCCPDMIGGGEYLNFQSASMNLDEELFVRHAEIACLMPSMQFSAAPFRVLDDKNYSAIKKALETRGRYIEEILNLLKHAASTGEPVIRYMSYEFPDAGSEKVIDQFMLGSKLLVAPIIQKGTNARMVFLPQGEWRTQNMDVIVGEDNSIEMNASFGTPIILHRL